MATTHTLYLDNNRDVLWEFMAREATGEFVNDAVVTMSLFAPDVDPDTGTAIVGAAALPMTYQSGSNGRYLGTLPYTLPLTVGAGYHLRIIVTSPYHAEATLDVVVVERNS